MDNLPIIITKPGKYITRNGKTVTIHDIDGKGTFAARGSIWKHSDKIGINPRFNIWHVSGRISVFEEKPLDIVLQT
jgi:hypothetical protein